MYRTLHPPHSADDRRTRKQHGRGFLPHQVEIPRGPLAPRAWSGEPERLAAWAACGHAADAGDRSGEHTSELQSPCNLVCRLLLEKKKKINTTQNRTDATCNICNCE